MIDAAFADAPRPANEELLHERFDDGDIRALDPIAHWHELPTKWSRSSTAERL